MCRLLSDNDRVHLRRREGRKQLLMQVIRVATLLGVYWSMATYRSKPFLAESPLVRTRERDSTRTEFRGAAPMLKQKAR